MTLAPAELVYLLRNPHKLPCDKVPYAFSSSRHAVFFLIHIPYSKHSPDVVKLYRERSLPLLLQVLKIENLPYDELLYLHVLLHILCEQDFVSTGCNATVNGDNDMRTANEPAFLLVPLPVYYPTAIGVHGALDYLLPCACVACHDVPVASFHNPFSKTKTRLVLEDI